MTTPASRSAEKSLASKSFVPALVTRSEAPSTRLDAAVLFVDAIDFTSRTSMLADAGPHGVERLSTLLDAYYSPLLVLIAKHGGETMRFVGDALIALFPAEERSLRDAVSAARNAGAAIQSAIPPTMPDGNPLAIRAIVTAGAVDVVRSLSGSVGYFVVAGAPMEELEANVRLGKAKDVLLAPSAKAHLADAAGPAKSPAPVAEAVDEATLERFVPPPVLVRIESGHLDWLAEHRRVTAVFVSVRGLEARQVPDVLTDAATIAERHHAFLKEVILDDKGWTLVALTGVPPFAGSDDAARAVRLARELQVSLGSRGLDAAVGVASGRAFCGAVGSSERREYAIVGTVMNLASRLSQSASDARIVCDEETARSARFHLTFAPLASLALKGFRERVNVHTPGADVTMAMARGGLVGRQAERTLLAETLTAISGGASAPAILLEGHPGMGKSQLAAEAASHAPSRGVAFYLGAAQSVSRSAAFSPWRGIIDAILTGAGVRTLADVEHALGPDDAPLAPLLEAVVSLGLIDNPTTAQITGQLRAQATRQLLVRFLARTAAQKPMMVLLEDAHWADAASWDLLHAVANAKAPGLFLLITSRPDAGDSLDGVERAGGLRKKLAPLTRAVTAELLRNRLEGATVSDELVDRVQERAAGNPLFIEQIALSLAESRGKSATAAEIESMELPATVEGAITGRIDRLSPAEQLTLKVASVVGPLFSRKLLVDVHPHERDRAHLDAHLALLSAAQLIDREADGSFRFEHEIVREVAYGMMPYEQRRALHAGLATWYEANESAKLAPYFALLAHHHLRAGNIDSAVDYLEREAVRAFSIGLARQSVAVGIDAAGLLGFDLPTDPAAVGPRIGELVGITEGLRRGRSPNELLDLPAMQDPKIGRALRLLLELAPCTFQAGRPELYALIGLLCLRLALEHGNGPPDSYSTYSVVHRAIHHDAAGAYAWSELARALDERQGGSARARVAFVHHWFHSHWVVPLRDSLPKSLSAAESALASGDILFGCYNLSGHVVFSAASGAPLDRVIDLARDHLTKNGRRVVNAAFHCIHEMQIAKALAGKTASPLSLTDDEHDEGKDVASICATDYYNQIGYYLVSRVKLHALFGDPKGALEWADKLEPLLPAISGQIAEIDLVLYRALALLDSRESSDVVSLDRARAAATDVAGWAAGCPANFRHLADLLAAAVLAAEDNYAEALSTYARSAEAAEAEGFVHHAALAHERATLLSASKKDSAKASESRARAVDAYRRWGAHAKVSALSGS